MRGRNRAQASLGAMNQATSSTGPAPARGAGGSATRNGRFDFLDALRGIAAVAVVLQHSAEALWPGYLRFSIGTFRLGEFGVVLFFLVSGFIIPASLEKYGSVGKFWVGRFFRLFPLYWVCLLGAVVLSYAGRFVFSAEFDEHPVRWFAVNASMVQDFVAGPLIIGASWSLAYELVFYLAMSILLIVGLNRRSVPISVTVLALAGVAGAWIPSRLDTGHGLPGVLTVLSATAAIALYVAFHARGGPRQAALGVGLVLVTVPLALNQPERLWFSLLLFGTMTVGTVMYRLMKGGVRPSVAWSIFVGAVFMVAVLHRTYVTPHMEGLGDAFVTWRSDSLTFAVAYGVFAVGFLLRNLSWPRVMTYLGTISYSLYLVHTLVLYGTPWVPMSVAERLHVDYKVATLVVWLTLSVAVASLTYRYVERPFQALGHRLTKRPIATTGGNAADALTSPRAVGPQVAAGGAVAPGASRATGLDEDIRPDDREADPERASLGPVGALDPVGASTEQDPLATGESPTPDARRSDR